MHTHQMFRSFALYHKALGNERRVYILFLLWEYGPMTGVQLVERLGIQAPAVSRHLHVLLYAKLIMSKRRGLDVLFSVNPTTSVVQLMGELEELTFSQKG